ncbi:hydroxymethylbilane synthase [Bifidobacterium sp. MA2]|uniref:Porphobilinogen deaminase n=1 Tax=Bifidobacterium santillanense TaxID=2809028 RepID=A0ABS5UQ66_9BIFI|nr:hydroxymethylbilane synthase [Bifidobacterium santillanense]MBT1173079.1 hydroxymethylbilane synthase [Bifidobacterium santillanense]
MKHLFRVGTRTSRLAMCQTELVVAMLRTHAPDTEFEIVPIVTQGDRDRTSSLHVIGGKGVFVKELERELEDGTIDFAAHSLKDVQPRLPDGLVIGCTPTRESPFDCLLSAAPLASIDDLPCCARVGTNSQRRQAQLLHHRPDLEIVPIRGNIDTRIRRIETERLDAIVLAEAGLNRLRPDTAGLHRLTMRDVLLPAAGQGAMAVECRADDAETLGLLARIDDAETRMAVTVERDFMRAIGGNCTLPIGAYARFADADTDASPAVLTLDAMIAVPDGSRIYRARSTARMATTGIADVSNALVDAVVRDLHAAGSPL